MKELVLLLDGSLGRSVQHALVRVGVRCEARADWFPAEAPDPSWMDEAARRGWLVLGRDVELGRRALARRVVASAGARLFVVVAPGLRGDEVARAVLLALPAIRRRAQDPGPFVDRIHRDGSVHPW